MTEDPKPAAAPDEAAKRPPAERDVEIKPKANDHGPAGDRGGTRGDPNPAAQF